MGKEEMFLSVRKDWEVLLCFTRLLLYMGLPQRFLGGSLIVRLLGVSLPAVWNMEEWVGLEFGDTQIGPFLR